MPKRRLRSYSSRGRGSNSKKKQKCLDSSSSSRGSDGGSGKAMSKRKLRSHSSRGFGSKKKQKCLDDNSSSSGKAMAKRRLRSYSSRDSSSKRKHRCLDSCSSSSRKGMFTRCSPSRLMKAMKNFTPEQHDLIRRNGFGGLLSLKCRNTPYLLYKWLVKHFNYATCELVFSDGTTIPVTAKSVHIILGIPNGGRKVKYSIDADSIAFMEHEYGYDNALSPRVSSIAKKLSEMKKADDRFLRTFLLLAISCLLCPTTSVRVSPRCFPSLVDISSVYQLDWCSFVLEQLVSSIKSYKHKRSIGGCLIFLAIHYLDHLDTGCYCVPGSIPRIGVWTTKVIEEVVKMDTISETHGIYGQRPVKAVIYNNYIHPGLKIPPIIGEGLTVEQFVSSHLAADCNPLVKDELCHMVDNFCTNATTLLSTFVSSFLRDLSGLIPSSANTSPPVCQKPTRASSQGSRGVLGNEGTDEYNTEDETSEEVSVYDDDSEDELDDENASLGACSDDVSDSDDNGGSEDESDDELVHEKSGSKVCKHVYEVSDDDIAYDNKDNTVLVRSDLNHGDRVRSGASDIDASPPSHQISQRVCPEVPVPPGFVDLPVSKQEPGSPADDKDLHQYTDAALASGNDQTGQITSGPKENGSDQLEPGGGEV